MSTRTRRTPAGPTPEELAEHSAMLGQIANEVTAWCCTEECTTLDAVRLLKADFMILSGTLQRMEIERRQNEKLTGSREGERGADEKYPT